MALIAVSIALHSPAELDVATDRAAAAAKSGTSLVEWRVDAIANDPEHLSAVLELVRRSPLPCIVTCRPTWEGGEYAADEHNRISLFESLVNSDNPPRYIDVELAAYRKGAEFRERISSAIMKARTGRDLSTSLILSTHDFQGRPADLMQRVEWMTGEPSCAVIKVAWQARSLRDNLEAFDLLRERRKPMIALCMGQFGLASRVLAGKFGALLTFATDIEGIITGPGQPTIDELRKLYRFDRIGKETRAYGVIGWPVEHSLSPAIHNAGFEAIGHDGIYLPLAIPPEYEHFKATVGSLLDHAPLNFRGASVTIPHKENLLRFVRERGGRIERLAERIGAANTLNAGSAGGIECFNTDAPAAVESLCDGIGIRREELKSRNIAVLGAGGAARAVIIGLTDAGANVTVFNRNAGRAAALVDELAVRTLRTGGDLNNLRDAHEYDVIINCTPVGMAGSAAADESPLPPDVKLHEKMTIYDTVYTPARTPLIREAEARGARTISGLDMFVRQAALQFERWTGTPAPVDTFQKVLREKTALHI